MLTRPDFAHALLFDGVIAHLEEVQQGATIGNVSHLRSIAHIHSYCRLGTCATSSRLESSSERALDSLRTEHHDIRSAHPAQLQTPQAFQSLQQEAHPSSTPVDLQVTKADMLMEIAAQ